MSKELFVSSTPHETKVAIVEDDQLTEVYFERENEYTLAGSIYKGRVTRVLPGMQSAFVNIGLDRDAFLYVSDFLLEEEEDADVLEQVRPHILAEPPEEAEPLAAARTEPIEAEEIIPPAEGVEGEAGSASHAQIEHASEEDSDREGARRWRGRRRRRGRERFPQREERPERDSRAAEPVAETHTSQAHEQPMILPGESISKYQPQSAAQVSSRPQPQPTAQNTVRPSTEYSFDPAQFSPNSMVLPGESLAKYRNEQPAASAAPSQVEPEAESSQAETPVEQEIDRGEHHTEAAAVASLAEPPQAHEWEPPTTHAVDQEAEEEHRMDRMNVANVFGGEAVEASEQGKAEPESAVEETSTVHGPDLTEAHEEKRWSGAGRGVVEEEEIEEEESELPGLNEERLDMADYEELEEEELAPVDDQMLAMGSELMEAVRDAHVNEHATGQYEAEGLENQEETEETEEPPPFEETEEQNGDSIETEEETEEVEEARAETRAPAGTAGYQQRAERRPERRGRRLGRRMRGRPRFHAPRQMPAISDLLKEGQEILVQIAKEPIAKKGARITSHIALPGRFLVYMPTVHHTGVSRKIASEDERLRLKRIVLSERGEAHGGFIVRTAAAGANEEDLRADIRFLINLWTEIRGRADKSKAPSLIYHDLNLVERILRDQVTVSFSSIWVDTEQEYERILRFVSRFQSSLVKRVKLYTKETPLFEQFSISDEINKALKSKVWLKSGGYIVINQTEALVAIDVNTGKYVGKTARLEDTIVKTNIDAIREIVRQIRLRDLGGIIVIDFIDMDERKNRQRVMQALEEALKGDRAPSKVLQFNDFGLVAITRKRVKQSLERTLGQQCPTCTGTGMIKSVGTTCNEIYVEMRKMSRHFDHDVMLRVHPEVAKALKANNARWLQEMEELTKQTILVKSDPLLHPEQFDIQ
jgi:ribonuclease G